MKDQITKHLKQSLIFIWIVIAFCMVMMTVAAFYYLMKNGNLAENIFKCLIIPLGIYCVYKVMNRWLDWLDR